MNLSKGLRIIGVGAIGAAALTGGFGAASCSDDGDTNSTPGVRVELATRVEIESLSFKNAYDWEIELSKVAISSGAIYYFDGAPIETVALHSAPKPAPGLLDWFAPRVAHAHPGHYEPGEAKGEMLESSSFDLAASPATLAQGEGISGVFRSGRFTWASPAKGPLASELGNLVLILEGTAVKGEAQVNFRLEASESDVLDAADAPELEGCEFEEADVQSNGTVTLRVDASVWLDQAEFDDIEVNPEGGPTLISAEHEAARAFVRGIKKSSALTFSFKAD